jgi:hypothetical protein
MATNFPTTLDSYTTLVDNVDQVLAAHVNDRGSAIVALETKLGVNSSSVNTTIDYFLTNASGAYRTHKHDGTSDDGALIPLASLSDFNVSSPLNLQILKYNTATSKWINGTLAMENLSNVTITGAATREAIYWNGSAWVNGYPYSVYAA